MAKSYLLTPVARVGFPSARVVAPLKLGTSEDHNTALGDSTVDAIDMETTYKL